MIIKQLAGKCEDWKRWQNENISHKDENNDYRLSQIAIFQFGSNYETT